MLHTIPQLDGFKLTLARLLPIASIITPATLSVVLKEDVISTLPQNVPRIDFSKFAFLADMPGMWKDADADKASKWAFEYYGPSQTLERTALSVAVRNDILPIDTSFTTSNTTWITEFHGPSLDCGPLDQDQTLSIQRNIEKYLLQECLYPPTYLAWYPRLYEDSDRLYHEPYYWPCLNTNTTSKAYECTSGNITEWDLSHMKWFGSEMTHDGTTPEALFYVALMPTLLREWDDIVQTCESDWYNLTLISPAVSKDMTLLKCEMHNSTYRVEFNYTSTAHDIHYEIIEKGPKSQMSFEEVPLDWLSTKETTSNCTNPAFGGQYDTANQTAKVQRCAYDSRHIPQFVYQSILESFTSWIVGNLTYDYATTGRDEQISGSTQIRKTTLFETKDLHYLTTAALAEDKKDILNFANLQSTIRSSTADVPTTSNMSLSDAIQGMFNNLTVSLLSQPQFRQNYSSATAPPQTEVTTTSSRTVYVYHAGRLWAAYGTAAFCTAISVALGVFAIFTSKETFRNNFSTIFRISRSAELGIEIKEEDSDGMTPLPPYLAAATVRFGGKGEEECDEEIVTGKNVGAQRSLLEDEESRASRGVDRQD